MFRRDDKLEKFTADDGPAPSIRPALSKKWSHPDDKLSDIIIHAAAAGIPKKRIADMASIDIRDLNEYYAAELNCGRDMIKIRTQEKLTELALRGHEKSLIYLHKTMQDQDYDLDRAEESKELDMAMDATKKTLDYDPSNLTIDEIRTLHRLLQKGRPAITVEAKEVKQ